MPKDVLPRGTIFWTILLLIGLFLPLTFGGLGFLSDLGLFTVYASANLMWTLVLGTAGIYSFATLAIVGASGYVAAYMSIAHRWPWPAMLMAGTVVGAVLGLLVTIPAVRLRGVYFALITFGLASLFSSYVTVTDVLGGAQGLYGTGSFVPQSDIGTQTGGLIASYAGILLLIVAVIVHRWIDDGRLGLLLRTARESESFAQALGIDVVRARLALLSISSAVLGLVGAFYVCFYRGISPGIFEIGTLLLLFAMIVVGGLGSRRGVLLGTAVLLFIEEYFLQAGPGRLIAIAVLMLLVTLFTRRGLVGIPEQVRARLAMRRTLAGS